MRLIKFALISLLVSCTSGKVDWGDSPGDRSGNPAAISDGGASDTGSLSLVELPPPGQLDSGFMGFETNFNTSESKIAKEIPGFSIFGLDKASHIRVSATTSVMDAEKRILILGFSNYKDSPDEITLVRMDTNGKPDVSFGDSGFFRFAVPFPTFKPRFMGLQSDGSIVILLANGLNNKPYLLRLKKDVTTGVWTRDLSYGQEGAATLSAEDSEKFYASQIRTNPIDDSVVVAGTFGAPARAAYFTVNTNGIVSPVVAMEADADIYAPALYDILFTPSGALGFVGCWSRQIFSESSGIAVFPRGSFQAAVRLADNSMLAAGITLGSAHPVVAKFLPSGALDPNFGDAGQVILDKAGDLNLATHPGPDGRMIIAPDIVSIQVEPSGNIFVLIRPIQSGHFAWVVAKLKPDGTLDKEFAKNEPNPGYRPQPVEVQDSWPVGIHFRKKGFVDIVFGFNSAAIAIVRMATGN